MRRCRIRPAYSHYGAGLNELALTSCDRSPLDPGGLGQCPVLFAHVGHLMCIGSPSHVPVVPGSPMLIGRPQMMHGQGPSPMT